MPYDPYDFDMSDVLPHTDKLLKRGYKLNESEVFILLSCRNDYLSVKQLSDRRGISYQSTWNYVKRLNELGYLDETSLGRTKYYKATINLLELVEDEAIRAESHGQYLTFEDAFYFLERERITNFDRAFKYCLGQIYYRAFVVSNQNQPQNPTSDQVLSTMKALIHEVEQHLDFFRSLANLPLSSEDPRQLGRITSEFKSKETHDKLMLAAGRLRGLFEGKQLRTTGFDVNTMPSPKQVAQFMRELAEGKEETE